MKNLVISGITLFTRAAIKGGVASQLALQLSDLYIMNLENCQNADGGRRTILPCLDLFHVRGCKSTKKTRTGQLLQCWKSANIFAFPARITFRQFSAGSME